MLKRKGYSQSPLSYGFKEATAWAEGYNTAVADQEMPPRKAENGDVGFGRPAVGGNERVRHDWWVNSPLSPGYRLTLKITPERVVPLLVLTGDGEYHINIPGKLKLTVY